MAKKIIVKLPAEDLKKKLNLKDGYTPKKGVDYFDGKKGDKGDTTIVEKVIEKTEMIHKQPIITNEIKEVAVVEDREQIVEKINKGKKKDTKIKKEQIEGLDDNKLSDDITNRAIGIVDQRTSFLINKINNLPVSSDEKVKLNASDPTAGYLDDKIIEKLIPRYQLFTYFT